MSLNIVTSMFEKYCEKNGTKVHISVNLGDESPSLAFTKGSYEQRGNTRVFLDHKEMDKILRINDIIGEGSRVDKILKGKDTRNPDQEIEKLIYNTLAKYVIQMLFSALAEILFLEIIPLKHHKDIYFRSREEVV